MSANDPAQCADECPLLGAKRPWTIRNHGCLSRREGSLHYDVGFEPIKDASNVIAAYFVSYKR